MLDLIFRICKYRSQKKGIYESRHQQRRPDRDSVTNKPLPTPFVPFTLPPTTPHTHTHNKLSGCRFLAFSADVWFWRKLFWHQLFCCVSKERPNVRSSLLTCEAFRGEKVVLELFFSCFEMLSNIGHFSKTPQTILMLLLFDCISKGYTCGLKPKSRPPLKTTGTKIQTSRGTLFKICDFICDSKHSVTSWSFNLVVTLQWVFLWSAFTVHSFKAQ